MASSETTKFLDKTALTYFWGRLKTYFVHQETGKGLSTNDLTNELKSSYDDAVTKANALTTAGAEANTINTIKVNGVASTPDSSKAVDITVPTKVSALTNDSGYQTESQVSSSIATAIKINTIKVNGVASTPDSSKAVNITVPTKVSALTNDSKYQTESQVSSSIATALGKITGISFSIVESLPQTGENGVIYLIADTHSDSNDSYDEYAWISSINKFEKIGNTDVDLSGYIRDDEIAPITTSEIDTMIAS